MSKRGSPQLWRNRGENSGAHQPTDLAEMLSSRFKYGSKKEMPDSNLWLCMCIHVYTRVHTHT